jgi:peptide-methionine (R)-S-oxide reductase
MKKILSLAVMAIVGLGACNAQESKNSEIVKTQAMKVQKTDSEWKKELSPEQYRVLRKAGTERAFSGEYTMHFEDGNYKCAACSAVLFDSEAKFESHCGWPSFDKAADNEALIEKVDHSHGMERTEILCAGCGGHLGHVFDDGPTETGKRYCINSAALGFKKEK